MIENYSALAGYLTGQFADSDLAGETDEEAAVSSLTAVTHAAHMEVYEQGQEFLNFPDANYVLIGNWANRAFRDDEAAREWLAKMMKLLGAALEQR